MKYYLTKNKDQQVELNIRLRMIELAAGSQAIQLPIFWRYPKEIKARNRAEVRQMLADSHREFDAKLRARLRSLSKAIE